MILEAYRQDPRVLTNKVNNVTGRSAFGEKKLKLGQHPFGGVTGKQPWHLGNGIVQLRIRETMVPKEVENRVRFLGILKTELVSGAEFGSRLWVKPKLVNEV